ncbi:Na/Pi cotransporter family protein [Rubritalea marina]|uniref:Na/Pi cotransporter family protein n=1 Tax=Rubritalea marina TaxID=361055 RepID=UPI0003AA899C|nr:Na/Pi cotransporter family protein [Rubritalea marina]
MMRSLVHATLPKCVAFMILSVAILSPSTWAAEATEDILAFSWGTVLMQLFGGLALFLFGMEIMTDAVRTVAGDGMRRFLQKMTGNRFIGAFSGALITAVLNSSSVTTVLVVGFISAGLMSLTQAISIIMGANIGSTFAAQIIAFNITQYALLPVAIGFLLRLASKRKKTREYGDTLMGLGLVFFGMGLMGEAMAPLREFPSFLELMERMDDPLLGILVGAGFTALIQSSAATTGIAIAMASGGLISLEAGVALALGSNIGTCITAILATIGKTRAAVRAAIAHVLINVLGVLLWAWAIPEFCSIVRDLSPTAEELSGAEKMAAEVPRQIANAHTLFNVINTAIFIWFTGPLARLCTWLVRDRAEESPPVITPEFLDRELLATPALALQRASLEIGRIEGFIDEMFSRFQQEGWNAKSEKFREIAHRQDDISTLIEHILQYLSMLNRDGMNKHDSDQLLLVLTACNYLQSLSSTLGTDLVDTLIEARSNNVEPSPKMKELMSETYHAVWRASVLCAKAIVEDDPDLARQVLDRSSEVKEKIQIALKHQANMLTQDQANRLAIYRVEMEFINTMKRIYNHAKRISKQQLSLAKEED